MTNKPPVLHIIVIGFHHKKGCQVEYSYPPLMTANEESIDCPSGWKYLPTLGLPDGSHNFEEDSVFFNLPSLVNPNETVYGISCYRQIAVEKLKIRTADVTRSTVQKSVCILATIPVYGYIEVKLSLIAHSYFGQGDFARTDILDKAYNQLNSCLSDGFLGVPPLHHIFVGLPLRDIVLRWRHKILILFKLMLLQKRVIFFGSPVRPICSLILAIASLHPQLLQKGFQQVACVRTSRPMSPMPDFSTPDEAQPINDLTNEAHSPSIPLQTSISLDNSDAADDKSHISNSDSEKSNVDDEIDGSKSAGEKRSDKHSLPRDTSVDVFASRLVPLCSIDPNVWSAPLPIFTSGNLCLPYLSLPYMDLLTDSSVHGYSIGTSNILFQQKRQLTDVFIDVEAGTIETSNADIRKQLNLTTEDLRFIEFILRHTQAPKEDAEGSERWIREQFQAYMLAMLRTSLLPDGNKESEHFNGYFMMTWKKTNCFLDWNEQNAHDDMVWEGIQSGHPFAGSLSVADMKLKIAQTMSNTESGRKLNQAVNTTSKAVGGAILQAKGAFTNWWSAMTTQPPSSPQQQQQSPPSSLASSPSPSSAVQQSQLDMTNNQINTFSTQDLQNEFDSTCLIIDGTAPSERICEASAIAEEHGEETKVGMMTDSDCNNSANCIYTDGVGRKTKTVSPAKGIIEIGHEAAAVLDTKIKHSVEAFTV